MPLKLRKALKSGFAIQTPCHIIDAARPNVGNVSRSACRRKARSAQSAWILHFRRESWYGVEFLRWHLSHGTEVSTCEEKQHSHYPYYQLSFFLYSHTLLFPSPSTSARLSGYYIRSFLTQVFFLLDSSFRSLPSHHVTSRTTKSTASLACQAWTIATPTVDSPSELLAIDIDRIMIVRIAFASLPQ